MFEPVLLAKFIHLASMSLMFGATVINGLLHAYAKSSPPLGAKAIVGAVLQINRVIMAPSLIAIPISGVWLGLAAGYDLSQIWILLGATLSALLIIAFLFGHRIEKALHKIAVSSSEETVLPKLYDATFLRAAPIGFGALIMSLAAILIMLFKPI